MPERASHFEAFWIDYLKAHTKPSTRTCHYIATAWGVGCGIYGFATLQWWYILAAILGGYAIAVGSHYIFKERPPLVARSPFWGAVSDFRMIGLALTGKLDQEFDKHQIPNGARRARRQGIGNTR